MTVYLNLLGNPSADRDSGGFASGPFPTPMSLGCVSFFVFEAPSLFWVVTVALLLPCLDSFWETATVVMPYIESISCRKVGVIKMLGGWRCRLQAGSRTLMTHRKDHYP